MASITPVWSQGFLTFVGVGYSTPGNIDTGTPNVYWVANPFIGKATLDLTGKHGAWVHPRIAKVRTSTWTVAPKFRVFRHADAAGTDFAPYPYAEVDVTTDTPTEHNIVADATAGDRSVTLEGSGSPFTAGDIIQLGTILAGDGIEWNRVVRQVTTTLHLEFPLKFDKDGTILQEDVHNKAIAPAPIWLPGGAFYEFHLVNNFESIASSGEGDEDGSLIITVPYETYDSDDSA